MPVTQAFDAGIGIALFSDKPVMTSGITSGAVIMKAKPYDPRNLPKRTSTTAAIVPRIAAVERRILQQARGEALNGETKPERRVSQQAIFAARKEILGLYMNWHADNPSPLIQRFIAMLDSNVEP